MNQEYEELIQDIQEKDKEQHRKTMRLCQKIKTLTTRIELNNERFMAKKQRKKEIQSAQR